MNCFLFRIFLEFYKYEFNPVASIIGSLLSQEIIKIITKEGKPIENIFTYDSIMQIGKIVNI